MFKKVINREVAGDTLEILAEKKMMIKYSGKKVYVYFITHPDAK